MRGRILRAMPVPMMPVAWMARIADDLAMLIIVEAILDGWIGLIHPS